MKSFPGQLRGLGILHRELAYGDSGLAFVELNRAFFVVSALIRWS